VGWNDESGYPKAARPFKRAAGSTSANSRIRLEYGQVIDVRITSLGWHRQHPIDRNAGRNRLVLPSSNYPWAIAAGTVEPLRRCAFIAKSCSTLPVTHEVISLAFAQGVKAAGFPAGMFALLHSSDRGLVERMMRSGLIAAAEQTAPSRVSKRWAKPRLKIK